MASLMVVGMALAPLAARADEKFNAQDIMFTKMVSNGNYAEIMTSQLALKKSKNKDVRMIAQMLIKDHGVAQKDLKKVAQLNRRDLPQGPNAMQKAEFRKLSGMSGMGFNKEFMKFQVRSHNATVALFKKELEDGNQTQVRSFATKYLPGIESHTEMIHRVASNMGIPVAEKSAMMSGGNRDRIRMSLSAPSMR